ncbi:MAG: serine hydrolase, partial [Acidobacteria bacterium]
AILDPALAKPALTPIADHEPEVARRVRDVLAAARDGKLSPGDFAYVRAGFFPEAPKRYARLLSGLGDPRRLDLLERRELGDDRVYTYDVVYEKQTLRLVIAIAPDGKLSQFSLRPR